MEQLVAVDLGRPGEHQEAWSGEYEEDKLGERR